MEGPCSERSAALSIVRGSWMMRRFALMALPLLLLAGCGGSPNDPGEGGVTRAEADALDQAAEQLDQQSALSNTNLSKPASNN